MRELSAHSFRLLAASGILVVQPSKASYFPRILVLYFVRMHSK